MDLQTSCRQRLPQNSIPSWRCSVKSSTPQAGARFLYQLPRVRIACSTLHTTTMLCCCPCYGVRCIIVGLLKDTKYALLCGQADVGEGLRRAGCVRPATPNAHGICGSRAAGLNSRAGGPQRQAQPAPEPGALRAESCISVPYTEAC